jgi:hypothetical protein
MGSYHSQTAPVSLDGLNRFVFAVHMKVFPVKHNPSFYILLTCTLCFCLLTKHCNKLSSRQPVGSSAVRRLAHRFKRLHQPGFNPSAQEDVMTS